MSEAMYPFPWTYDAENTMIRDADGSTVIDAIGKDEADAIMSHFAAVNSRDDQAAEIERLRGENKEMRSCLCIPDNYTVVIGSSRDGSISIDSKCKNRTRISPTTKENIDLTHKLNAECIKTDELTARIVDLERERDELASRLNTYDLLACDILECSGQVTMKDGTAWLQLPTYFNKFNAEVVELRTRNAKLGAAGKAAKEVIEVVVTEVKEESGLLEGSVYNIGLRINGVSCARYHGRDESTAVTEWRLKRDATLADLTAAMGE